MIRTWLRNFSRKKLKRTHTSSIFSSPCMVMRLTWKYLKKFCLVKMNTDHHFVIGKTHKVCEDYALSGEVDGIHYAIVCDGCSSSPDTDFGARILARAALRHIKKSNDNKLFANLVSSTAETQAKSLGLPGHALDSTLIVVSCIKDYFYINMYGDGAYHVEKFYEKETIVGAVHDGMKAIHTETIVSQYEKSMPYYLSYLLNKQLDDKYWKINTSRPVTYLSYINMEYYDEKIERAQTSPWIYEEHHKDDVRFIAVMSDGVESFEQKLSSETSISTKSVQAIDVLKELVAFKGFKGEFVKRRMIRALKDFNAQGIHHNDDVSLAVIYNDEA